MRLRIRGQSDDLRRAVSFAFSATTHAAALGWIVMGATFLAGEKPLSIYEQTIKPHADRIIWYNIRNRLPDVNPAAPKSAARPLRALRSFPQQIVSGPKENARPSQTILTPAPPIALPKSLPLPNVLSVAAVPKPVRAFVPPPEKRPVAPAPARLPDAPAPVTAVPVKDLALKLQPPKAPLVPFQPPPDVKRPAPDLPALPAAPAVATSAPRFSEPRIPKTFTPPEEKKKIPQAADPAIDTPAPEFAIAPTVKPTLAIVGLNPVEAPDIPSPPGSHEAGFSAGAKPRLEGSDTDARNAPVTAPGLLARGGTREAQAALIASLASPTSAQGIRNNMRRLPAEPPAPAVSNAPGTAPPPDPRLAGRAVYVVAIQMPNITSYSGSWLVWYAERAAVTGPPVALTAPVPVHKVDPKYIASARDERVEGAVRLFGIIRATGQVDSVELLRHVDDRLDRAAQEALLKWQFEPAKRDGVPVDVEAVFEIPFHLAPRAQR